MKIKFINDWRYLFNKDAVGGRFSAFTFITIAYLHTGMNTKDIKIDGLTIIFLGLGVSIQP